MLNDVLMRHSKNKSSKRSIGMTCMFRLRLRDELRKQKHLFWEQRYVLAQSQFVEFFFILGVVRVMFCFGTLFIRF